MRCFILFIALLAAASAHAAEPAESVTLKPGFKIQALFENDETCDKNATFSVKRARATLDGSLADRLTAHLTIETIDSDDGIVLLQGYATYLVHRALKIQAGQMYIPFGIENRRGFDKREFYDRSFVTDQIVREMGRKQEDRSGRFRDIGVTVHGQVPLHRGYGVNYAAMVFNGNGILTTDNNDEKDLAGSVLLSSFWGLSVGGSAYTGTWLRESDTTEFDEQAFGVGAEWIGKIAARPVHAQAEYLWATWDTDTTDIEPKGFYIYGAAFVHPKVEAGVRYESFERPLDPDEFDFRTATWERLSLTVRYHLGNGSLVAADYEIRDKDFDDIDNRLIVQILAVF